MVAELVEHVQTREEPSSRPGQARAEAGPAEATGLRTYVVDTSVLLSDPRALLHFAEHEVVLPLVVVSELEAKRADLAAKAAWLEGALGTGPYFAGHGFSLVDAAFGPVFRYFDTFEATLPPLGVFAAVPKVQAWRAALAVRPSVQGAVAVDYPERLTVFLRARGSHLARLMS